MDVYGDGNTVVWGGERAGDAEDLEQGGEIGGDLCPGGKPRLKSTILMYHYARLANLYIPRAWCVYNKTMLGQRASYN